MALFFRLVRALYVFGVIFCSYMVQLALLKLFRKWVIEEETGREVAEMPAWLSARQQRIDLKNAKRLLAGMLELRGVFIKMGQVLSVMGGFLPEAYGKELETLQDAVPPRPFAQIRKAFIESVGRPPEECYRDVSEEPLAAASLGQVHVAHLEDGTKVAVKVLYPGIRGIIKVDMRVIQLAMRVYQWFMPVQNLDKVHASLVDLLERETNYLHEAECMRRMAANFADEDDILFPAPIEALTTREVLTMTFMEGFKITDLDEMARQDISPRMVSTRLVQSFYKQLFVHRFFHADPHPGNFLVQAGDDPSKPRIVVLDFGAISEVQDHLIDGMIDVLRGFFESNDALALSGLETMGFVSPDGDRELLEATAKKYFAKLLQVKDNITAGALTRANEKELRALADPEVTRRELRSLMKSVNYPDGWFYVERAAVLAFWLAGNIDPDLDTMQVGFPYVLPILSERLQRASA